MDIKDIKKFIRLMEEKDLVEFEYEEKEGRVRIKRALPSSSPPLSGDRAQPERVSSMPSISPGVSGTGEIVSPMVGTFYQRSSPESEPFVEVGQSVRPDDVVCVIEAMKVMNEVTADCEGEIVEVLAKEGSAVEYGQPLFRVRIKN